MRENQGRFVAAGAIVVDVDAVGGDIAGRPV
jgi:hypothetical protein